MTRHKHDAEPAPPPPGAGLTQETNVIRLLADHLPGEHAAVVRKIGETKGELVDLEQYKQKLERIGTEAGVALVIQEGG